MPTKHAPGPHADLPPESEEDRQERERIAAEKAAEPQERIEGPHHNTEEFVTPRMGQSDASPTREPRGAHELPGGGPADQSSQTPDPNPATGATPAS